MFDKTKKLSDFDPELSAAVAREEVRQEQHIELIASENYTSPQVMALQGSVLTNKYAEGYPGKRYYGGCENVDVVEQLAIDRAKALFGADYANVQPHSGSQANAAVYMALMQPGETFLGLSLDHGGHLTHGAKPNFSGKIYNAIQYGLNPETGEIDYDQVDRLAQEHKPKMIVAGFSAASGRNREISQGKTLVNAIDLYVSPYGEYRVVLNRELKTTHALLIDPTMFKTCTLRPGMPVEPMLAKPTKSIQEVLKRLNGMRFTCEFKYDG